MNKTKVQGSCFCGAIQFEIDLPSKFVAHCHCSECRRSSGAPLVTWIGTWEDKFRVISGKENLTVYSDSPEVTREFCRTCGTQLFFRCDRWKGEVHVTRSSILSDVDRAPQAHVFYSDKAHWYEQWAKLPVLGGENGTTPLEGAAQ